jgi:hypothetical protein
MVTGRPTRGLKFYPASHRYKLDGEWVPGVTTILGVLDKPGLRKWAASSVAEYVADHRDAIEHLYDAGRGPMVAALKETPWQKRDDAATRGNVLHDYAEALLNDQDVIVADEHVAVIEAALQFMDDWKVRPVSVEQACASREHRYAGTWDLVADVTDPDTGVERRAILDWKSGKRIYAGACFQMNAYAFSEFYGADPDTEKPTAELGVEAAYGVHIRADGYDVHEVRFGRDVYDEFLVIRKAFDINKRAEGDWKQPGSGYVAAAWQRGGAA